MSACSAQSEGVSGRVAVEGSELAYQVAGNPDGDAVVLIHGGMMADAFSLLLSEPVLADYRLITYHRRGYGDSAEFEGISTLEQQTDDVIALLDHLNVDQAHFVGHSAGGPIALSVAVTKPSLVRSVISLEGFVMWAGGDCCDRLSALAAEAPTMSVLEAQAQVAERMRVVSPDWQEKLPPLYPGVVEQVMGDALMVITQDVFLAGRLEEGFYGKITAPVLSVVGGNTSDTRNLDFLPTLAPDFEYRTVEGLDHAMQILYPQQIAELIAEWLGRH